MPLLRQRAVLVLGSSSYLSETEPVRDLRPDLGQPFSQKRRRLRQVVVGRASAMR